MYRPKTARGIDAAVLRCLLDERFDLWAVAALERKFRDRAMVAASLARLRRRGLIYEGVFGFVTATHVARSASRTTLRTTKPRPLESEANRGLRRAV